MRKRNLPNKRTSKVRRQRDPIPWKYCLLTLVCGLILVAGFFMAARSHFSSMDYGMKNAKLRKQIEDLKSETRRLQLSKEISLSPGEIKKAAIKLGLTNMTARNIEVIEVKKDADKDVEKEQQITESNVDELKNSEKKAIKIKDEVGNQTQKKSEKLSEPTKENKSKNNKEKVNNGSEDLRKNGNSRTQIAKK